MIAIMFIATVLTSCHGVSPDGDEVAVLIKKPWFFGHGGVEQDVVSSGLTWCAWTTTSERFKITPVQYTETFEQIITKDNNPIDFTAYLTIRIHQDQAPNLYSDFGKEWYANSIKETFRTMARQSCKSYTMFQLTTDEKITIKLQDSLFNEMTKYVTTIKRKDGTVGMPIEIRKVTLGKAQPPDDVIKETMQTAAQKQKELTQAARTNAENARKAAEEAKARADKAYMGTFGMSVDQYLKLRALEIEWEKIELIKDKKDVKMIFFSGAKPTAMVSE